MIIVNPVYMIALGLYIIGTAFEEERLMFVAGILVIIPPVMDIFKI